MRAKRKKKKMTMKTKMISPTWKKCLEWVLQPMMKKELRHLDDLHDNESLIGSMTTLSRNTFSK